VLGSV
jgi:hypothetical protein